MGISELSTYLAVVLPPALSIFAAIVALSKRKEHAPDKSSTGLNDISIAVMQNMQRRITELERTVQIMYAWVGSLSSQVITAGGKPISLAEIEAQQNLVMDNSSKNPAKILGVLRERFSIEELEVIGFMMGAREGTLGKGTIDERALNLIRYCEHNHKMIDLVLAIQHDRPSPAQ